MALQWSSGNARIADLDLAWEQTGPERGEPAVLVMGLGGQLIHWPESFCESLVARGFRVIRFDNRDAGFSGEANRGHRFNLPRDWLRARLGLSAPSNYSLHDMAADTVGLLDALGISSAHLIGASMGGMIAQIAAGRYPQRVKSLTSIMSSTNHPKLPPARLDVLWRMSGIGPKPKTREGIIRRSAAMLRKVGSPAYPSSEAQRRERAARSYDRAFRPGGVLRQTHAVIATGSFESLLSDVRAPAQIIHGLADPLLRPACGQRSARLIRGSKLELIPGMGHDFPDALMPRWAELAASNAARA